MWNLRFILAAQHLSFPKCYHFPSELSQGEQNIIDMTEKSEKTVVTASPGLFADWAVKSKSCPKATMMELLLPLGQGASQDCSGPLVPNFQRRFLCNVRVGAAVDTNRALHSCARKIRKSQGFTHRKKTKPSGAGTRLNYSAKTAPKGGGKKKKSNKRKITREIY